ncbi:MAG: AraC family transcriptional regulator [Woeseia sp.]
MKPESEHRYIERIDRVVGYLNEQAEASLTLQNLADIAGVSRFHFHRLYRAITGETPSATLRRLRLARAANMLKNTQKSITEIAFDVGYESSQAFSKAFRRVTGSSASGLRRDERRLAVVIERLSNPPTHPTRNTLEVRLVSIEPFKVIASRHVGPHKDLFNAYGALFRWAEETDRAKGLRGIFGIAIDDPRSVPEDDCRFDCCFDLGADVKPENDFRELVLGGGLYAVTRHVGPYEGLEDKNDFLYGTWLPTSGYTLRDVTGFNHYLADPDSLPSEKWETDICIPVA